MAKLSLAVDKFKAATDLNDTQTRSLFLKLPMYASGSFESIARTKDARENGKPASGVGRVPSKD